MVRIFWKGLPGLFVCAFLILAGIPLALAETDNVSVTADMNSWITISDAANVDLGNFDRGTDSGNSTGTAEWTVATNNTTGYKLELSASTDEALRNDTSPTVYYFNDYNMDSTTAPSAWSVAASAAEFGYTASGNDVSGYSAGTLYRGFAGASAIQIATSALDTSGTATTARFRAQVGSSKYLREGGYTATITATATSL
ncbi:MAG: hypothetical protein Q8L35_02955 [Actinomycetota bacterium]|nr:hypothetical protein [Actinomycetota bacterium]